MTDNAIVFNIGDPEDEKELLRLDEQGFYYKGELIEDAGEAYKRFSEWLDHTEQFVPEEIINLDEKEKE